MSDMDQINSTAFESYGSEGPGVGMGAEGLDIIERHGTRGVTGEHTCLEIGFGKGELIRKLIVERGCTVHGYDLAEQSLLEGDVVNLSKTHPGKLFLKRLDASHDTFPLGDDTVNLFDPYRSYFRIQFRHIAFVQHKATIRRNLLES